MNTFLDTNIINSIYKIIFIIAGALYFIFSLIILRQVQLMTSNIKEKFNQILMVITWVHLGLSLLLLISLILI